MFKKDKYHGEVWFPESEDTKCFCLLTFKDGQVSLETNLVSETQAYKHQLIHGAFTGLGRMTFLDCEIRMESSGIIRSSVYSPKYTFILRGKFLEPTQLIFRKFNVSNSELIDWLKPDSGFDRKNMTFKIDAGESHQFNIDKINLVVEMAFSSEYTLNGEYFSVKKNGTIRFHFESPIKLIEAIEVYDKFQKLLQFLCGNTSQFNYCSFQSLESQEWTRIYFNDNSYKDSRTEYLSIRFKDILPQLSTLMEKIYTDKHFYFCIEKLLDNQVTGYISHSKRFTNSISCLEAYSKLLGGDNKPKLNRILNEEREIIKMIGKISDSQIDAFLKKIIRSRNYHVHCNIDDKDVFTDFELLYISFLLDFVIAYKLLRQLDVAQPVLDDIVFKGNSVFLGLQGMNKLLNDDYLREFMD